MKKFTSTDFAGEQKLYESMFSETALNKRLPLKEATLSQFKKWLYADVASYNNGKIYDLEFLAAGTHVEAMLIFQELPIINFCRMQEKAKPDKLHLIKIDLTDPAISDAQLKMIDAALRDGGQAAYVDDPTSEEYLDFLNLLPDISVVEEEITRTQVLQFAKRANINLQSEYGYDDLGEEFAYNWRSHSDATTKDLAKWYVNKYLKEQSASDSSSSDDPATIYKYIEDIVEKWEKDFGVESIDAYDNSYDTDSGEHYELQWNYEDVPRKAQTVLKKYIEDCSNKFGIDIEIDFDEDTLEDEDLINLVIGFDI